MIGWCEPGVYTPWNECEDENEEDNDDETL